MSFWFFLEIGMFIVPFIFLKSFFKIVVEARDYRDKVHISFREFLYGYDIFNTFG